MVARRHCRDRKLPGQRRQADLRGQFGQVLRRRGSAGARGWCRGGWRLRRSGCGGRQWRKRRAVPTGALADPAPGPGPGPRIAGVTKGSIAAHGCGGPGGGRGGAVDSGPGTSGQARRRFAGGRCCARRAASGRRPGRVLREDLGLARRAVRRQGRGRRAERTDRGRQRRRLAGLHVRGRVGRHRVGIERAGTRSRYIGPSGGIGQLAVGVLDILAWT